jgi:hypothetical protein
MITLYEKVTWKSFIADSDKDENRSWVLLSK